MITPGELSQPVTIWRGDDSTNAGGEWVPVWSELATTRAKYAPVSDGERIRAAQVQAHMTARFTIRWSEVVADLNPRDRIEHDGLVYEIAGVKALGRQNRQWLEITAWARAE